MSDVDDLTDLIREVDPNLTMKSQDLADAIVAAGWSRTADEFKRTGFNPYTDHDDEEDE